MHRPNPDGHSHLLRPVTLKCTISIYSYSCSGSHNPVTLASYSLFPTNTVCNHDTVLVIYPFWNSVAVKSIKKQHLVEVRSMANPPAVVKVALESICLLLGENTTEWRTIRSVTMRENFISTIVNFNTEDIT
jgi:hypothetical protein